MDIQDQNTILIVDDIEMNREILDCIFNKDYKTPQFNNGLDAFLYTKDHADEIVAVLLDITMPIMDGYGYLEHIRENNLLKGVPIFLITAENKDQQLDAFEYQISDIIEKPFNSAFLYKRVNSQIELFKLHRSLEYKNLLQEREIARKKLFPLSSALVRPANTCFRSAISPIVCCKSCVSSSSANAPI